MDKQLSPIKKNNVHPDLDKIDISALKNMHKKQPINSPTSNTQSSDTIKDDVKINIKSDASPKNNRAITTTEQPHKVTREPLTSRENHTDHEEKWNYRMKLLLKKVGEKSMGYRWLHDKENEYYYNVDYTLSVTQLVLSSSIASLTSGTVIQLLGDNGETDTGRIVIILTIINLILSLLLTIVMGIRDQSDYKGRSNQHHKTSVDFSKISNSIAEQFSLRLKDREDDTKFLKEKIKEYDKIMQASPLVRRKTLDAYVDATKNKDIYKPAIVGDIENIDIENDEDNRAKEETDTLTTATANTTKKNTNQSKINYEITRWLQNF